MEVTTMRSDTPYSDLYEKTFDIDALAQCTVQWALWMLRDDGVDEEGRGVASRALRLAMSYRREMRDKRNLILAESFRLEVCDG